MQRDADMRDAAAWFAALQAGSADQLAFEQWREDPAHALAFARVTATWEGAAEQPAAFELPAHITRRRLVRGGMAGAIAVAAGSAFLATRAYAWDSASTEVGETRRLRLPDGSMAMLNTDTRLQWRFSAKQRELWLDRGEVALDLQPGATAHLVTRDSAATLDPGRFNARLRGAALELIVLRGSARSAQQGARPAGAYQQLSFATALPSAQPVSGEAVEAALAWQSGDVVFVDAPLADAVAEYNRYLLRPIVIDDPALATVRIGGRFVSSDPADFLRAVSTGLGVRVSTTADAVHLRK
ncbi:FecR domain-containing protein [Sphingomonas sp. KR3-1]|uniref:FecR family protein n=1 Tax=Sphingomonas sp. KR3-1 TaxID=3156611 RepID=UPI0032B54D33